MSGCSNSRGVSYRNPMFSTKLDEHKSDLPIFDLVILSLKLLGLLENYIQIWQPEGILIKVPAYQKGFLG